MPYRSWHRVHRQSMAIQAISHTCAHTHIGTYMYTHVHTHRHMSCSLAHDTPSAWNSLLKTQLPWPLLQAPSLVPSISSWILSHVLSSQNNTLCSPPWPPSIMPQLPTCTSGFPTRLWAPWESGQCLVCPCVSITGHGADSPVNGCQMVKWMDS